MNLKAIFLAIIFHGTISPFSFSTSRSTSPFASPFKDPTHEECRMWAQNKAYLGAELLGVSLISYMIAFTSKSALIFIMLALPSFLNSVQGSIHLIDAGRDFFQHSNPHKSAEWLIYQKQFKSYEKDIARLRQNNDTLHAFLHNKRLQIGAAAIALGFLTSYTEMDNRNPALILTFAGAEIIAEKIMSELRKL